MSPQALALANKHGEAAFGILASRFSYVAMTVVAGSRWVSLGRTATRCAGAASTMRIPGRSGSRTDGHWWVPCCTGAVFVGKRPAWSGGDLLLAAHRQHYSPCPANAMTTDGTKFVARAMAREKKAHATREGHQRVRSRQGGGADCCVSLSMSKQTRSPSP